MITSGARFALDREMHADPSLAAFRIDAFARLDDVIDTRER
jgi:hypothetical protein